MPTFYNNLLKATDNTESITHEKYATVTRVYPDNTCDIIEDTNELQHEKAIIPDNQLLKTGDKVIIGFVNNNIYDPYIVGALYNPHQYHILLSEDNFICYYNNFVVYVELKEEFDVVEDWQQINELLIDEKYCPKTEQIILIDIDVYAKLTVDGEIFVKANEEIEQKLLSGSFTYPIKNLL